MPEPLPEPPRADAPEDAAQPLAGLRFCLVGPGRVGTSLAAWATLRGARLARIGGRRGRRPETVPLGELASGDCDLLLVAVADGALAEVARTLAARPQARVALHTSGSLGASVLAPLAGGSATGSFHPLKAFPRALPSADDLARAAGTFYALDGGPEAVALGERLAAAFGGVAGVVPEAARDLYHLGATVAAGGVATLAVSAADLAARSVPQEGSEPTLGPAILRGYLALARGALGALAETADAAEAGSADAGAVAGAITGPLARGDHATFLREMESLRRAEASAGGPGGNRLELLCRLGLETVRLTAGEAGERALAAALRERGLPAPAALRSGPADC